MKTAKNRKLHGSVLFTVVFVMSILIVFLFGTLALALATNNRAHVNYSSAQTKITARTVAESAIKAIDDSTTDGKAYAQAVAKLGTAGNPGPLSVNVSLGASSSDAKLGTMGRISPVTITYAGQRKYYDLVKGWVDRDVLKFTATVTQNGVESTTSVYAMKFYEDDTPSGGGGGGGGAGFVTVAGADLACQTSLFGGAYINLPQWDEDAIKARYPVNSELTFYEELRNNSINDIKKIGDTLIFSGSDYFYGRNSGQEFEADVVIYNNFKLYNLESFLFPDEGKGITVFGDFIFDSANTDKFHMMPGEALAQYYKKTTDDASKEVKPIQFNKIPFIYVNGELTVTSGAKCDLGNHNQKHESFPLNVFVGTVNSDNPADFYISGDLFCMKSGAENVLSNYNRNSSDSKLYGWVGSVVNRTEPTNTKTNRNTSNSVYVNGNLTLKGDNHIYGDLRVAGDLKVEGGNTVIEGDFACGGTITNGNSLTVRGRTFVDSSRNAAYVGSKTAAVTAELPNLTGQYYEWRITKETASDGKTYYMGPNDEKLGKVKESDGDEDPTIRLNGEDVKLADIDKLYYALKPGVDRSDMNALDNIMDGPYRWGDSNRWHLDDNEWEYYAVTKLEDGATVTVEGGTITNLDELRDRRTYQDSPYAMTQQTTFTVSGVDTSQIFSLSQFKSMHSGQDIYPKYAERSVVLGIENINGLSKDETQVVKTIRDILNDVANPYASTLENDTKMQVLYNEAIRTEIDSSNISTMMKDSTHSGIGVVVDGEKRIAEFGRFDSSTGANIYPDFRSNAITSSAEANARGYASHLENVLNKNDDTLYIAENCTLNFPVERIVHNEWWTEERGGLAAKSIIIDPGSTEIFVVIKGLSIDTPASIIVDDSQGGKAYIYVDDDSVFQVKGNKNGIPAVGTAKYIQYINRSDVRSLKLNSPGKDGDDILTVLGAPNLFIYGGKNSTFINGNFSWMAANVMSPDLKVELRGTDNIPGLDHVYYDGEDVLHYAFNPGVGSKYLIFGCLNAGSVTAENVITNIFVPDGAADNNKYGDDESGDSEYNYWIMYYSDF